MPDSPEDYEAQYDAETLVRTGEILKDKGRLSRAQAWAEERRDVMAKIASDIAESVPKSRFIGAVRSSKMKVDSA